MGQPLAREGLRLGEALGLRWRDLDLERGVITLDENKTDDARSWALALGVPEALKVFRPAGAQDDWLVFGGISENRAAEFFREHLALAGVKRPELTATTAARRPIRIHDLRASFVTLSLAQGRSETWVADRTGHRSSVMINRYRRQARQVQELALGELAPLAMAIPELAERIRVAQAKEGDAAGVGQTWAKTSGPLIPSRENQSRFSAVSGDGIEPPTRGFSTGFEADLCARFA